MPRRETVDLLENSAAALSEAWSWEIKAEELREKIARGKETRPGSNWSLWEASAAHYEKLGARWRAKHEELLKEGK